MSNVVSIKDLRRHIALSSSHQTLHFGYILDTTTHSSVAKLHPPIRGEEDVVWLDIKVDITVSMHFRYENNEFVDEKLACLF
jgi:hypothetical protein